MLAVLSVRSALTFARCRNLTGVSHIYGGFEARIAPSPNLGNGKRLCSEQELTKAAARLQKNADARPFARLHS